MSTDDLDPLLSTSRVRLASLSGIDRTALHQAILNDVPPRSWRGIGPDASAATIENALTTGVLSQMAILERSSERFMGLAQLCLADFLHGTVQLTGFLRNGYVGRVWPIEGFILFLSYGFHSYPLRKIYAEVPEVNEGIFGAGLSRLFRREGTLADHEWHQGAYRSVTYYSIERSVLENHVVVRSLQARARREPN